MRNLKWYLLFSFVGCWGISAWLYFSGAWLLSTAQLGFSLCMLTPALAVVLTKCITHEGWSDIAFRPNLRGHLRFYLLAWFGPSLLILAGSAFYYLCRPAEYSSSLMIPATAGALLFAMLIAPLLNIIFCAGEELGWRGYLLPKLLQRHGMPKALLFSGLIWGLWHAPIIAMGHNYGLGYPGWPWLGIVAMILFCIVTGCLFAYVTLRSGTFWPAALAHGALNGMASSGLIFHSNPTTVNPFIGPLPVGILGGLPLLLAGALCFFLLCRRPAGHAAAMPDNVAAVEEGAAAAADRVTAAADHS